MGKQQGDDYRVSYANRVLAHLPQCVACGRIIQEGEQVVRIQAGEFALNGSMAKQVRGRRYDDVYHAVDCWAMSLTLAAQKAGPK